MVELHSPLRVKDQESLGVALGVGCTFIVRLVVPDESAQTVQIFVKFCDGVSKWRVQRVQVFIVLES